MNPMAMMMPPGMGQPMPPGAMSAGPGVPMGGTPPAGPPVAGMPNGGDPSSLLLLLMSLGIMPPTGMVAPAMDPNQYQPPVPTGLGAPGGMPGMGGGMPGMPPGGMIPPAGGPPMM